MVESQQVLEWMAEGELKRNVQLLLRLLEKKFPPNLPGDLVTRIQGCTDLQQLTRWFDAAIDATTLDEFRDAMKP